MRGRFVHNDVLVGPLRRAFEGEGWSCDTEVPVRMGESMGFIDLVAELDGYCIAVEAEMSARRIDRDLQKAQALSVAELWIITPDTRVSRAVRRALQGMDVRVAGDDQGPLSADYRWNVGGAGQGGPAVFLLAQATAHKRVRSYLPLFAGS